ncbi:hypothetical protein [Nocardioides sp.]|uniref:hypothetical protein n=1 Tax=Nocardioides sp. TaxID=35761 RepID=UPI00271C56C1|nr:hypothetical protein [Nocardioides sp.]MDO9456670.1 hypothetical protein [Nocardioides sp.]
MGHGREQRRVHDPDLPFALRYLALQQCVEWYCPLGFTVTLELLADHVGGAVDGTSAHLVAAADLLEASRAVRWAEQQAYAVRRTAAKRDGRRVPPPGETTPDHPRRWHLDPQAGARFALDAIRRRHELTGYARLPLMTQVYRVVGGTGTTEPHSLLEELDRRTSRPAHPGDEASYFEARTAARVLEHLRVLRGDW